MSDEYVVYLHTFPNGKYYVGITCQDVNRRWRDGKGYEGQPVFDAILKYGWENIKHEILMTHLTKAEAEQAEIFYISKFDSLSHANGYNIETGGNCTKRLSDETKSKISASHIGKRTGVNHWHYGGHWSDEVKHKISNAHRGKKQSKDLRQKKSIRFSGANNPMFGTKMSPEHKRKLQEACVKATSKPVLCIETGIVYASSAEAQRQTGIHAGTIGNVCRGNPKYKTAGGYHWEFREEVTH